jgi:hypothetical protein
MIDLTTGIVEGMVKICWVTTYGSVRGHRDPKSEVKIFVKKKKKNGKFVHPTVRGETLSEGGMGVLWVE